MPKSEITKPLLSSLSFVQSWLGKPKFAIEGVIIAYDPDKPEEAEWNKIKNIPSERILATLEGSWRKQIKYRRKGEKVGYWWTGRGADQELIR